MLHCTHIIKIIILSPITDLSHTPTAPFGTVTPLQDEKTKCMWNLQPAASNFEFVNFLASHDHFNHQIILMILFPTD